jgi:NADH-quinone oxidoreductase subunit J
VSVETVFIVSSIVAVFATAMVITRRSAVHALLYLVVSLLAVAIMFYTLGAPFVAALEVIVYAGAIVVLILFAVMLLDLGGEVVEHLRIRPSMWVGPVVLGIVLVVELIFLLGGADRGSAVTTVGPVPVGAALFGAYALGVELASMLLFAALIGARHLSQRRLRDAETLRDAATARDAATGPGEAPSRSDDPARDVEVPA